MTTESQQIEAVHASHHAYYRFRIVVYKPASQTCMSVCMYESPVCMLVTHLWLDQSLQFLQAPIRMTRHLLRHTMCPHTWCQCSFTVLCAPMPPRSPASPLPPPPPPTSVLQFTPPTFVLGAVHKQLLAWHLQACLSMRITERPSATWVSCSKL